MTNELTSDFRRQLLWRKAQDLAVEIVAIVKALPRDTATIAISNQLMRSGASIAANIAEGYGRFSQPAYRNHLSIARGSALETISWLDLLGRTGYLPQDTSTSLINRCIELRKLVTLRMKSLGEQKTYAVKEEGSEYELD